RPEQIIASLQFEVDLPLANQSRLRRDASAQICDLRRCALHPENPAGFSAKIANLLQPLPKACRLIQAPYSAAENQAVQNESKIHFERGAAQAAPHPIEMKRSFISMAAQRKQAFFILHLSA
ncbi:MAG: hypothetical protein IKR85_01950, partial [Clostridia bacterium]|nr:hypothetical protein [Clostridia bacterium]